jgi:hypothetical protein
MAVSVPCNILLRCTFYRAAVFLRILLCLFLMWRLLMAPTDDKLGKQLAEGMSVCPAGVVGTTPSHGCAMQCNACTTVQHAGEMHLDRPDHLLAWCMRSPVFGYEFHISICRACCPSTPSCVSQPHSG